MANEITLREAEKILDTLSSEQLTSVKEEISKLADEARKREKN